MLGTVGTINYVYILKNKSIDTKITFDVELFYSLSYIYIRRFGVKFFDESRYADSKKKKKTVDLNLDFRNYQKVML